MATFFKVACPECKKSLKVNENLAGKSRACPYCRATVRIPEVEPQEPESTFPNIQVADIGPSGKPRVKPAAVAGERQAENAAVPKTAKPRKKIKRHRAEKSWFSSGSGDSASSDVSLLLSGIIGLVVALIWYGAMYPLANGGFQFGQLFWNRGPIPFPTTFLMFWALAILVLKWLNLKKQKEAMLLDVLPTEVSQEITITSIDGFIDHINELPGASADTFLVNRVIRGIEHFRVRRSAAETVTMMESQSAIDANNVAGSYTILKVFIWSLPILGFIGTVMGVSQAVASLGTGMNSGGMDGMKDSLNMVFGGLGTAFDTTLLALIMSMLVKIPASAIQKSEEDLITSVDEYCNENLLRRLNDGREGGVAATTSDSDTAVFRQAVEQALGTQHAEMERWLSKLDAIGTRLSSQVAEGWDHVNDRIEQQQQKHVKTLNSQQLDQQARLQAQLDQMANAAGKIQSTLNDLAKQAASMQNEVTGSFAGANTSLQENFQGLQRGLNSLSGVLEKLGDQQVVVQQVESEPVKSGWFGGGKKSRTNSRTGGRR
ncbi:MAG: MotA/TolQ/ExbB proton channel family protein [Pirellulaceae bacterium]